jgi:hypothetical protein
MSDQQFVLPPVPLMTPERARDVGSAYKALASQLTEAGVIGDAARLERTSQWWLTYSIALAQTLPKTE